MEILGYIPKEVDQTLHLERFPRKGMEISVVRPRTNGKASGKISPKGDGNTFILADARFVVTRLKMLSRKGT
jgi:hypothetical protein